MVNLSPLINEAGLITYLAKNLPGPDANSPVEVIRVSGGHSNETFIIRRGREEWVLRRPPRGPLLPTAHDVGREFKMISGLIKSNLPVPRPVLNCTDESVIGAPFYLMDLVPGVVIRNEVPEGFNNPAGRAALAEELIQTLVKLHAVDWRKVGLENLGKPEGYLDRQLKRWCGQLEKSRHRAIPELDELTTWLTRNKPESPPTTIVHGDFRLDNVIFNPEPPARIVAVIDWEMATLGDPLADLGYLISNWRQPEDPPPLISAQVAGVSDQPGFPTRQALAARYQELSGRSVENLKFYEVLAAWKLAILLEGNYVRYLAGTTDDQTLAQMEEGVPGLARRALERSRAEN